MFKYVCEFTVKGIGGLPIDMMRYDRCTPLTQEDASKTFQSHCLSLDDLNFKLPPTNTIRMIRFTEGNGKNYSDNPTVDRWKSFGWQVSDISWRKL